MPKSQVFKRAQGGEDVGFNMTPMIDVTFQLIIFFILAGQAASEDLARLKLPKPTESQATNNPALMQAPNRVVVNVLSKAGVEDENADPVFAGQAKEWRVAGQRIEAGDRDRLRDLLEGRYKQWKATMKSDEFFVEIRADHRVNYGEVEPAMLAASAAGIPKMNITAILELGK